MKIHYRSSNGWLRTIVFPKNAYMKKVLLFLGFVMILASCRKEKDVKCTDLKTAIEAVDIPGVQSAINNIIFQLSDQTYNSENLNRLVSRIGSLCEVTAETVCFDCIKTNPSMSEIRIKLPGGTARIIDISYTPNNYMVFKNMHN
jgi:hypothetical protein